MIGARFDDDIRELIADYRSREGVSNSRALRELVTTGARIEIEGENTRREEQLKEEVEQLQSRIDDLEAGTPQALSIAAFSGIVAGLSILLFFAFIALDYTPPDGSILALFVTLTFSAMVCVTAGAYVISYKVKDNLGV